MSDILAGSVNRTWIARRGSENWWPKVFSWAYVVNRLDAREVLAGDEVIYAEVVTQPSGDDELYVQSFSVEDGGVFVVETTSGQPGRVYKVFITATCASGIVQPFLVNIEVSADGALSFPPPPPVPGPGGFMSWPSGVKMFGPVRSLPSVVIQATGATQVTAAVVTEVSNVLINAASAANAGVLTAVPAAEYRGREPMISNWSGVTSLYYPAVGDTFIGQAVNTPITLVHTQSVRVSVSANGFLVPGV